MGERAEEVVAEQGCRIFKNRLFCSDWAWVGLGQEVEGLVKRPAGNSHLNQKSGEAGGILGETVWLCLSQGVPREVLPLPLPPSSALLYFRRQHRKWAFTMSGYRKLSDY